MLEQDGQKDSRWRDGGVVDRSFAASRQLGCRNCAGLRGSLEAVNTPPLGFLIGYIITYILDMHETLSSYLLSQENQVIQGIKW